MNIEGIFLLPISLNIEYKTVKGTIPKRDKINRKSQFSSYRFFFRIIGRFYFFVFQLQEFINLKNIFTSCEY
ncbi:hypothetical protein LEP1GSC038_4415 [Leptospira weilii str. 2006001855]|uniref:Uncharacterized protein n=2 Tax=Leptospira weilii TaxID=28184 RepID=M6PYV7_9LEPT|nr:hypothetical protein LEP1GSC038_4415 [Leptospira weilii str. 2006001855]EMN88259.1 hypothetical protein LEP1GSC108_1547 [Leptospira weilii str. UI 13098]